MSDGYYNEYSEDLAGNGRQGESGSGLRAMLEEALGKINNLQSEISTLKSGQQAKSTTDLLESKGINPAVAQIIPEGANASEWLEQYGHLFDAAGGNLDEGEPGELPKPEEEVDPDLLAEQEAWEAAHGVSSGTTTRSVTDPFKQLDAANSEADVLALIEQATRSLPGD